VVPVFDYHFRNLRRMMTKAKIAPMKPSFLRSIK